MSTRAISSKLISSPSKLPHRVLLLPSLSLSHLLPSTPRPKQPHQPHPKPTHIHTHTRTLTTTPQPKQPSSASSTPPTKPPSSVTATPLSPADYHTLSDTYIDSLVSQLEEIQDARQDVDVEYSAGVLTLHLPPHGTYVLNKQPPNRQIWLSSPISGPKRYDWVRFADPDPNLNSEKDQGKQKGARGEGKRGQWVYLRDGSTLSGLLGEEVGVVVGEGEGEGEGEG